MARKIPCQYCKQRRRKCERSCETEPCQRCVQMKKKCIPQDLSDKSESTDEEDSVEDLQSNLELTVMNLQVQQLENELRNMEITLHRQKELAKKELCWDIEFNGTQLVLKSEIKSLEELMLYGQSVIRYLSPFGHSFGTTLKFERPNPSFIKVAMRIVARFEITDKNSNASNASKLSQRFSSGLVQFVQPTAVINRLIDNYFSCMNDSIPILHEASYREHYKSIKDPMTDPITLAVCASVSILSCKHSFFNSQEKRYVGEFFYERAVAILTDIFDDPNRALESLLVCNLLQSFMLTTLRLPECRRWASVAVLLSSNLVSENPGCSQGDESIPRLARIKYSTIHRNAVLSEGVLAIIEFLVNNRREEITPNRVKFDILPDEPKRIQEILEVLNNIIKITLHPASIVVVTQARHMAAGEVGELRFEDIVRYEAVVSEWWHNLPENLKICEEPMNCTVDIVQNTDDLQKLLIACYHWVVTLNIQGCLIQPKPKDELENVYNVVRDRAIYLATYASDIILALAKKLDSLGTLCYSPHRYLIRSIDSLMNLIQHKDKVTSDMAREKLREFMKELAKNVLPDHQVSPIASPYSILSMSQPGSTPSVSELYKNYPLPGEALVYDIISTTVNQTTNTYTC